MKGTLEDRFWAKVNEYGPTINPKLGKCWMWMGALSGKGYGRLWDGDRKITRPVAQIAWELQHKQPFPEGKQACHHCDNMQCARWSHIFVGTNGDNQLDSVRKGRHRCARQDICIHDHSLLDEKNVYHHKGKRRCRMCVRLRHKQHYAKMRQRGYWKSGQSKGWRLLRS